MTNWVGGYRVGETYPVPEQEEDVSKAERLTQIKEEVKELMDEAYDLVRATSEGARAKAYWYAHVVCALDSEHQYLGGSMCTMQESIDALEDEEADEEVGEEE